MTARYAAAVIAGLLAGCQTANVPDSLLDLTSRNRLERSLDRPSDSIEPDMTTDRSPSVDLLLQEAVDLLSAGRDDHALQVLARILRAQPDHLPAIRLTAAAARRNGDWQLQNAALMELIERHPDSPELLNECGRIMLQSLPVCDDHDATAASALKALRRAVELAPDHPDFARDLFVALNEQNRDEEAEAVLCAALRHCPQDPLLPMAAARYFEARGRQDEAIRQYSTALQITPRNRLWRRERGMLHARMKSWDLACDDLQMALRGTPSRNQEVAFRQWARASCEAGRYQDALEALQTLYQDPAQRTAETELLRIRSLIGMNQPGAARTAALLALSEWPDHQGLRQIAARMKQDSAATASIPAETDGRQVASVDQ